MGVVRREGDWRLEKQDEGVYEITYKRKAQVTALTSDYSPGMMDSHGLGLVQMREVDSYAEAVGLFEEKSQGGAPFGFEGGSSGSPLLNDENSTFGSGFDLGDGGNAFNDVDLPPGGFALALVAMGVLIIANADFAIGSTMFLVGALFVGGGIAIFGWAGLLFKHSGWDDARAFLTTGSESSSDASNSGNLGKTPPPSQKIKDTLFFERAQRACEWCETQLDNAEVHHIKPRSGGGPNTAANLIVLCPNCHQKAHGTIPRSKLRYRVRQRMDEWDGSL